VKAQIWRRENTYSQNQMIVTDLSTVRGKDYMPNDICFPINEVK
jgi:hypothetical protein